MKRPLLLICTLMMSLQLFGASDAKPCGCTPEQLSKMFTQVAEKATAAVVYIKAELGSDQEELSSDDSSQDPFNDELFNRFFGYPFRKAPKLPQLSQGSGFFVTAEGHMLTNAHVVKDAKKITIVLNDGREMKAEVVGFDTSTDVAVIKADGKNLPFLPLGDSDAIELAEWVLAIGSPFQLRASVTAGIVSAKGRQNLRITDFEDFIQTDAAINPGNSGGPLINLKGEVIGINTAIVSKSGGYLGIGFAIPSRMASHIMQQILDKGTVTRGFLGVALQPIDQDMADAFGLALPEGALVAEVVKGSPAEKGGLKQGDIIIEYNGAPVKAIGTLRNEIAMEKPGAMISLKVNRSGQILTLKIKLVAQADAKGGSEFIKKLGMEVEPLSTDLANKLGYAASDEGLVVTKVKPGSTAATAGIRPGFLILAINHKKVATLDDLRDALGENKNNRILILARQGNVTRFYSLKVD